MSVRIGVLVPPGNPTVEPELYRMAPAGVSIHFARLEAENAPGTGGATEGLEARTRLYLASVPRAAASIAEVNPSVVVLAHTASSYAVGFAQDPELMARVAALARATAVTAAAAVEAALRHLGVKRLALATPYSEPISRMAKAYWESAGFDIAGFRRLENVTNIYEETEARAYGLAREADVPQADAVLLSGTGLPTAGVLATLERELGKPVVSSNQASLWRALRLAGVCEPVAGFGRLLTE